MGDTMNEGTPMFEHNVVNKGIDPALLAALGAGGGGMFGGGNQNMLWPLLFLFGRGFGGWGGAAGWGDGVGVGGAGFAARAVAQEAITTSKDVATQLSNFQNWCCENSALLQQAINSVDKSICCSTRDILSAVNALTPQMYQSFATLTSGMNQGFATQQLANCQSTAAIQHALCEGFAAASRQACQETAALQHSISSGFAATQLDNCKNVLEMGNKIDQSAHQLETIALTNLNTLQAQADRIALQEQLASQAQTNALNAQIMANANATALGFCQTQNQLSACCCDIKSTIKDDGNLTRALINQQEMDRLRSKLEDTKDALSNANQSILLNQQLQAAVGTIIQHIPHYGPYYGPFAGSGGGGGTTVDVDVTQRQRQRQGTAGNGNNGQGNG